MMFDIHVWLWGLYNVVVVLLWQLCHSYSLNILTICDSLRWFFYEIWNLFLLSFCQFTWCCHARISTQTSIERHMNKELILLTNWLLKMIGIWLCIAAIKCVSIACKTWFCECIWQWSDRMDLCVVPDVFLDKNHLGVRGFLAKEFDCFNLFAAIF